MLTKFKLPALTVIGAFLLTSVTVAAIGGAAAWLAWAAAAATAVILIMLAATSPTPRRGAIGFLLVGLGGAVFISASGLALPVSLLAWAWTIIGLGMSTIGLAEDADAAQSAAKNRL